jgi:hypothetical protein
MPTTLDLSPADVPAGRVNAEALAEVIGAALGAPVIVTAHHDAGWLIRAGVAFADGRALTKEDESAIVAAARVHDPAKLSAAQQTALDAQQDRADALALADQADVAALVDAAEASGNALLAELARLVAALRTLVVS